jgi:hypothetical protein
VTDVAEEGAKTIVTAQVGGIFHGSPIQLPYHFALKNGKIAALDIWSSKGVIAPVGFYAAAELHAT